MTNPPLTTSTKLPDFAPMEQGVFARTRRVFSKDRLALIGAALILLMLILAAFGQWLAPFPSEGLGVTNVGQRNLPPSAINWFGTDQLGRDVLSRIIMGARPALVVALTVVALAALIGIPLGAIAGYRGGWIDNLLMRITEIFQAFPPLLLAMVIVAVLGPSLMNAGIALAVSWWPWYARLIRAEARSLRERPYVEAARSSGVPAWRIIPRHILRNAMTPVLIQATVDVGTVVLAAGSLAFIGLGAQPPEPDWGLMVAEGRGSIFSYWWVSTFPGLAIFITVLGFNLLGDSLRDLLDPRQVKR